MNPNYELYAVEFEGNRLDEVTGVNLFNHNFTDLPNRKVQIHKIARRSLSIVTSSEYESKEIRVFMDICGGTRAETEEIVTTVKALTQAQNGSLKAWQGNSLTEYTATLNEFNTVWNSANAYCELVFIASTPIGEASQVETLFNLSGVTGSTAAADFTVGGSFNAQPTITITITSVTGGGGASISLVNALTNQGITITANQPGFGSFDTGDIIEINTKTYKAQRNGIDIDYSGIFPTFPSGLQQASYSDTFTTRTVQIAATYNRRFV